MDHRLPAAVLWDMDGTLVDTEPFWFQGEYALAEEHGGEWTHEDALNLVGNDMLVTGAYLRDRWGLEFTPTEMVDKLHDKVVASIAASDDVPWRPGALDLLESLNEAGIPCALVTMSWDVMALPIVARLPRGRFDAVITGDKVVRGKPHPDPYLEGAAALGARPADCIAIEDSNTGATSAETAGCTVITVENHVALAPGRRRIAQPTLVGLTPTRLGELLLD
ncbi:haloacid dehalogenase [Nocardioides baekrokdamisoli]|uniref:Haloacid dehalogenase n=1 Tax=Nocardioides baekrokdamisoli TaxID=1804624 RepID=A0A3G9IAY8_9ACTN|nr:HAD family phosphatase [Nocardioides baekrokdamisoli]BBH15937.1 haloacid dehalogenase [Nocardioides baekrokdamisoli]